MLAIAASRDLIYLKHRMRSDVCQSMQVIFIVVRRKNPDETISLLHEKAF
jgi:hypothetical protein